MSSLTETGYNGEDHAAELLISKGYTVLARNYHSRYGEIDIIAQNGTFIVFAEVKVRKNGSLTSPLESVNTSKCRKIIKTAVSYLMQNPSALQPRFDIIALEIKESGSFEVASCEHYENAFSADGAEFYV